MERVLMGNHAMGDKMYRQGIESQGWRNKQNGGNGNLKTGLFQILLNVVGMNATGGEVHMRMDEVLEAAKKLMIRT